MNATASPLLEAKQLRFSYDGSVLFSSLCFVLAAGGLLQIVGANGSGKTSLIKILCGLMLPDSGYLFWQQRNIHRYAEEYRENIAYIGHKDGIKGDLTPLENLRGAATMNDGDSVIPPQQALAQWGLHHCEAPCRTLSAGQRRRVALARLLITRARLWLLDEPLTALDAAGQQQLGKLAATHTANGGAIIISTHQLLQWPLSPQVLRLAS